MSKNRYSSNMHVVWKNRKNKFNHVITSHIIQDSMWHSYLYFIPDKRWKTICWFYSVCTLLQWYVQEITINKSSARVGAETQRTLGTLNWEITGHLWRHRLLPGRRYLSVAGTLLPTMCCSCRLGRSKNPQVFTCHLHSYWSLMT